MECELFCLGFGEKNGEGGGEEVFQLDPYQVFSLLQPATFSAAYKVIVGIALHIVSWSRNEYVLFRTEAWNFVSKAQGWSISQWTIKT